jgi:mRNA-degrading endonuclease RelE of RelBE toxin-antitoxin system
MYSLEIEEEVSKTFKRLLKKDRKQLEAINKKIELNISRSVPVQTSEAPAGRASKGPHRLFCAYMPNNGMSPNGENREV